MKWSKGFSKKTARRYQSQIKRGKLVILTFLLIAFLFVTHQLLFTIHQVSCHTPTDSPCPLAVNNLLDGQKGKSLLLINKKKMNTRLQEVSPSDQIEIKLTLPGKLIINTRPDQPLAVSVFLSYLEPSLSLDVPPINQLDHFVSSASAENYDLFPNGELIPGQDTANINLLFAEKPSQDKLKQAFWLITEINKQTPISKGYLLKDNFFFTSPNLPDTIIPLGFSAGELFKALQSIPSLVKIKEEVKIIDLRFNHPIIR